MRDILMSILHSLRKPQRSLTQWAGQGRSWQREHDLYGKGGSTIYLWAYPKDKPCVNTQIYFTKVPFMDSLLNEILSRLKITHGKGSSSASCSGCTAFSLPQCVGLGSASLQALGPGSLKSFTLRHKVIGTALLLAFHRSHSSLERILSNGEAISEPIPYLVLHGPVCGNHFEKITTHKKS